MKLVTLKDTKTGQFIKVMIPIIDTIQPTEEQDSETVEKVVGSFFSLRFPAKCLEFYGVFFLTF